jgi:hypothetical protein
MPWTLDLLGLATVFVVLFVAGLGWTLGVWLMDRILAALTTRRPPAA